MSLLLLFNPSPSIVGFSPSPVFITDIETISPTLILVESAEGVFTESEVAYSSSSVTYSSSSATYGGSNQSKSNAPVLYTIDTISPTLESFKN